uniref:LAM_G_DOMAIN domain-containing protein n=1 Tax=Parastrongyloides trichosuri TaxID=131310 RepID=A0A0N4Z902_PARTI
MNSVSIKINDTIFTLNFSSDKKIPHNLTVYEDSNYVIRNNAGRKIYIDKEEYYPRYDYGMKKNETIYEKSTDSINSLKITIVVVSALVVVILLLVICFYTYQFANAKKILLKRLNEDDVRRRNIFSKSLASLQHSMNSNGLVTKSFTDNYMFDHKKNKEKSLSMVKNEEKNKKIVIMTKNGELVLKDSSNQEITNTEISPKIISSMANALGFLALLGVDKDKTPESRKSSSSICDNNTSNNNSLKNNNSKNEVSKPK